MHDVWSTQPNGWKILCQSRGLANLCVGSCNQWLTRSSHNFCRRVQQKLLISSRDCRRCRPLEATGGNTRTNIFRRGGHRSVLPEDFINSARVSFLEPPSIFPFQHPSPPPPFRLYSWPVSEAAACAPPLGSPLRKATRCADETRPQTGPNSRCELYKRLPFSPDIHKKDSLCTPPPLKFNLPICFPLLNHFFPPLHSPLPLLPFLCMVSPHMMLIFIPLLQWKALL